MEWHMKTIDIFEHPFDEADVTLVGTAPLITRAWDIKLPVGACDCVYNRFMSSIYWINGHPGFAGSDDAARKRFEDAAPNATFGFPTYGIKYSMEFAEPIWGDKKTKRAAPAFRAAMLVSPRRKGHDSLVEMSCGIPAPYEMQVKAGRKMLDDTRAKFDEWSLPITILRSPVSKYTMEQILEILELAGREIGIGSLRPSTGGEFGTFSVET